MLIKIAASATRTQAGFEAWILRQPKMARIYIALSLTCQVRIVKGSSLRLVLLIIRYNSCTVGFVVACSVFTLTESTCRTNKNWGNNRRRCIYYCSEVTDQTTTRESGSADFPDISTKIQLARQR